MFDSIAFLRFPKEKLIEPAFLKYSGLHGGILAANSKYFSASIRGEYYQDLNGVLSGIVANNMGLKSNAITLGVEYKPIENAYVRFEYTYLRLDEALKVFFDNTNVRNEVTVSMGFEY